MKNLFLFLTSFYVIAFLSSCGLIAPIEMDDECEITSAQYDSIYKYAGIIHNIQLDSVLHWLATSAYATLGEITILELNETVWDQVGKYSTHENPEDFYLTDTIFFNGELANYSVSQLAARQSISISEEFSDAADEIVALIANASADADLNDEFDDIYEEWIYEIESCIEKLAFTAMVSVGKYSWTYWQENFDEWSLLAYGGGDIQVRANRFKDVALQDAVGAATGALKGGYVGLVAGSMTIPGVGTIAGAAGCAMAGMLIGCIGGSAGSALFECFKWAIGW